MIAALGPTWCYWCDRPKSDCICHLDPNGIPDGHWSKQGPPDSQAIPPYPFIGNFPYSLRCVMCRLECPHTEEQHLILSRGMGAN